MAKEAFAPKTTYLGGILEEVTRSFKKKEALRFEGREISYDELNSQANRVANGLAGLGIGSGDRVAMMLPNIPEFAFTFYGIQKLGAVAVPFNSLYKSREIAYILKDSGAKAIVCLGNFVSLIDEIRDQLPDLQHVITTGQRSLVFVRPGSTANVQMVMDTQTMPDGDTVFRLAGEVITGALHDLGVTGAEYLHRGSIRARGLKLATITVSAIENLYMVNGIVFLKDLEPDEFFKVIWVSPEVRDKVVEPSTSVETELGREVGLDAFRDAVVARLSDRLGVSVEVGDLKRDELFGYEKTRALAYRK